MSTPAPRPTSVRHYVLAALLIITAINYVQRNCIGPAATTIEKSIGVTSQQLDAAAGAFFFTYTLLQIPSGTFAKRWGPRLVLPLYAAGWSVSLAACAWATDATELYYGRIAIGAFQAGIFPCATLVLSVWYPPALRGTATALLNSFMLLGGAAGGTAAGYLLNVGVPVLGVEPITWQTLFLIYSVPGLVWALLFVVWFRDRPADHPAVNAAELALLPDDTPPPAARPAADDDRLRAADAGLTTSQPALAPPPAAPDVRAGAGWLVFLSLPLLLICVQQSFRAAAPRLFDYRLPTYLEKERGLALKDATALSAWPQYAGVVGGLLGGMLSDYILRRTRSRYLARNGVAVGGLAVCLCWYVAAWYAADVYVACGLLAAGSFFFNFSSPASYALVIDIGGKHLAVAFGAMNMTGNFGAYIFVTYLSWMVAAGGWPLAFGVWAMLHVVALVCWLFLDPSKTLGEAS
ncbi:MAG: MFS transporter [Gemmataceae bacterium]